MCSDRALAAMIALVAAVGVAQAQPAPDPVSDPAPDPVSDPAPDPDPDLDSDPDPDPVSDPDPDPVPVPAPDPAPEPPRRSHGAVLGLEIGVGATPASEGMFAPGLGKAFMLGYRIDAWSFELRFGESYDQPASNDRLADAGARGPLLVTSAGFRRALAGRTLIPEVLIGGARLQRPILVNGDVTRQFGVGAMLGGGVALPLGGGLLATAEARAYLARWDNPPGPVSTEPVDDGAGGVTFTPTTDATSAIPITVSVGLKILL